MYNDNYSMTCMFYGLRSLSKLPGWHYIVFVLNLAWLYRVHPDMNIIIKYKCGMTVCDEMHMYDILVK